MMKEKPHVNLMQGLIDNENSPYSKLYSVGLADVEWTDGFWNEQFEIETDVFHYYE